MSQAIDKHKQAIHYAHRSLDAYMINDIDEARRFMFQALNLDLEILNNTEGLDEELVKIIKLYHSKMSEIYRTLLS